MHRSTRRSAASTLLASALFLIAGGADPAPAQQTEPGAPYVPTPMKVVVEMLEVAGVSDRDTVYDLGSGDGRLPIAAARLHGSRGVGVELDSGLVARSRRRARAAGVDSLVRFVRGDLFDTDLGPASVVTLYLFPGMNERLRPRLLRQLDPGDHVVSHDFAMGEWEPDSVVWVPEPAPAEETEPSAGVGVPPDGLGDLAADVDSLLPDPGRVGRRAAIYLWEIPADVGGTWRLSLLGGRSARIRLDQRFQELRAAAAAGIDRVAAARVHGDSVEIELVADGDTLALRGHVEGGRIRGRAAAGGRWSARRVEDTDASILEWEDGAASAPGTPRSTPTSPSARPGPTSRP